MCTPPMPSLPAALCLSPFTSVPGCPLRPPTVGPCACLLHGASCLKVHRCSLARGTLPVCTRTQLCAPWLHLGSLALQITLSQTKDVELIMYTTVAGTMGVLGQIIKPVCLAAETSAFHSYEGGQSGEGDCGYWRSAGKNVGTHRGVIAQPGCPLRRHLHCWLVWFFAAVPVTLATPLCISFPSPFALVLPPEDRTCHQAVTARLACATCGVGCQLRPEGAPHRLPVLTGTSEAHSGRPYHYCTDVDRKDGMQSFAGWRGSEAKQHPPGCREARPPHVQTHTILFFCCPWAAPKGSLWGPT